MRQGIGIQAADMQDRNREIKGRLDVGGKKIALLGGMMVGVKRDMQNALNVGNRAEDVDDQSVWISAAHGQTVGGGKVTHGLIILLRGAEPCGELLGG